MNHAQNVQDVYNAHNTSKHQKTVVPGATFRGVFGSALQALWSHRQRSILTIVGISIGIASFIGVVALSQGVNAGFLARFSFITTMISISPTGGKTNATPFMLTAGDIQALANEPQVAYSSPAISSSAEAIVGDQTWRTTLTGVSADYQAMFGPNLPMSAGAWWSGSEDQQRRFVAVLGGTVAQNLFPAGTNPLGQSVRINQQMYRIIGILQQTGTGQDDVVYVPYTVVLNPLVPNQIQMVTVQADSVDHLDQVQAESKIVLEQRHRIRSDVPDGFSAVEQVTQVQQYNQFLNILTILMISISTISLVVGGIGIMNIMLVSVTERTREIGLRAALGAQPWDICLQFLLEAITLSLIGGIIGLITTFLLIFAITSVVGLPYIVTPLPIILGLSISTAIGIGFGYYPARRASQLDPIIALRSA